MKSTENKQAGIKFHKLTYKLIPDLVGLSFDFQLVFDGFGSDYMFDIVGLKASSLQDGIYPIIICSCGMIGCGGIYITTKIQGEELIWEKFWDGQSCGSPEDEDQLSEFDLIFPYDEKNEHLLIASPISFQLSEYLTLSDELVKESIKLYKNEKQFQDTLEEFLSGDVFIP